MKKDAYFVPKMATFVSSHKPKSKFFFKNHETRIERGGSQDNFTQAQTHIIRALITGMMMMVTLRVT